MGLRRGELGGMGDLVVRGEGDLEMLYGDEARRSEGEGERDTAGVESGDSSLMSQYSSLMSGVDCLLFGF